MKKYILILFALSTAFAVPVRVGTLNCYCFFKPEYAGGAIKLQGRPTGDDYKHKVENLGLLLRNTDIVGLQETELGAAKDLAAFMKFNMGYVKGKDTYTGENTATISRPSFALIATTRSSELDKLLSKHTLSVYQVGANRVWVLSVHLIRPIGVQDAKHQAQLDVLGVWANAMMASGKTLIVLGDFNDTGENLIKGMKGTVTENTHYTNKQYDHIYVSPGVKVLSSSITRPPYAKKPSDIQKTLWTDHYLAVVTVDL